MKTPSLSLGALALVLSACDPVVLDLAPSDTGSADASTVSATSTGSGPGPGEGAPVALAMRGADAPSGALPVGDPESLVLYFSNQPLTCEAPVMVSGCDGSSRWQFILSIPPELDRVGLIGLDDPRIGFVETITLPSCGGGGGSGNGFWGTLEILSLDEDTVTVRLTGTTATSELAFDGDYVAERCGAVPVTPPPTPAVAMLGASVVGNPSSGTGPTAGADSLYLFGGSVPGTCEEPVPIVDCASERQFVLSLPPEKQVPGSYPLDSADLDAIYHAPGTGCGPATFDAGTLEVTHVDAETVEFSLVGTGFTGLNGMYSATRCP